MTVLETEGFPEETSTATEATEETMAEETSAAAEETVRETEPSVPEAEEGTVSSETLEVTIPETGPLGPEETQPANPIEEDPFQGDDWLFTLTDVPADTVPESLEPAEPAEPGFFQFAAEHRLEFLLAAGVLSLFGAGTCWFGNALCGLRFLLRLRGIRTTGTLSRVSRDYRTRAYRCTMTYPLENGRTISSEWPVHQHLLNPDRYLGRTYTVYYDPQKPNVYDCAFFGPSKLLGTLTVLMGLVMIAAALAAVCCVLISFTAAL